MTDGDVGPGSWLGIVEQIDQAPSKYLRDDAFISPQIVTALVVNEIATRIGMVPLIRIAATKRTP